MTREDVARVLREYNLVATGNMEKEFREVLGKQLIPHHVQNEILDKITPMIEELGEVVELSFERFIGTLISFEELVVEQMKASTLMETRMEAATAEITARWLDMGGERMRLA